jgi:hypothetical protein
MSTAKFITKQHVKYYWKVMKGSGREDTTDVREQSQADSFWQYEQTPRYM